MGWHWVGGTGAPIIRVTSLNHTNPWHTNTWEMGLLFIECLLGNFQYKKGSHPERDFYIIENVSSSWVTVCTSHPYLFLAIPGTPHLTYNNSKIFSLYTSPCSIYASCLTHANVTQLNLTMAFIVCRQMKPGCWLMLPMNGKIQEAWLTSTVLSLMWVCGAS